MHQFKSHRVYCFIHTCSKTIRFPPCPVSSTGVTNTFMMLTNFSSFLFSAIFVALDPVTIPLRQQFYPSWSSNPRQLYTHWLNDGIGFIVYSRYVDIYKYIYVLFGKRGNITIRRARLFLSDLNRLYDKCAVAKCRPLVPKVPGSIPDSSFGIFPIQTARVPVKSPWSRYQS